MRIKTLLAAFIIAVSAYSQSPLPTKAQIEWQKDELCAFIHFGLNTFNNVEWGYGDASPSLFNPTRLDCEQWVRTLKAGGMKCVILTAKHHDGFCLWPTKYTDYNISASPYKNGKGDIVRELSDACRKYGMKFGVYLSPWDRHQSFYGTEEYITYYKNQLTELLTQYGEITEVWLDGANGGDGYYGGACETRKIDRRTYYHFDELYQLIHSLQPNAIIFSDGGPGCRWVGNEKGIAGETNWSFLRFEDVYPGYPNAEELTVGHSDGTKWIPAECDVSIRPGWFYHADEDDKVKTPEELGNLYLKSVGRNGKFLLNIPPNQDGLISPIDSLSLVEFNKWKTTSFKDNLFAKSKKYVGGRGIYFYQKKARKINTIVISEDISKGQHVSKFHLQYLNKKGEYIDMNFDEATTTIGYKRILTFDPIETRQIYIRIEGFNEPFNGDNINIAAYLIDKKNAFKK